MGARAVVTTSAMDLPPRVHRRSGAKRGTAALAKTLIKREGTGMQATSAWSTWTTGRRCYGMIGSHRRRRTFSATGACWTSLVKKRQSLRPSMMRGMQRLAMSTLLGAMRMRHWVTIITPRPEAPNHTSHGWCITVPSAPAWGLGARSRLHQQRRSCSPKRVVQRLQWRPWAIGQPYSIRMIMRPTLTRRAARLAAAPPSASSHRWTAWRRARWSIIGEKSTPHSARHTVSEWGRAEKGLDANNRKVTGPPWRMRGGGMALKAPPPRRRRRAATAPQPYEVDGRSSERVQPTVLSALANASAVT